MMRQSLGYACRLLQANKVAHGGNVLQVGECMSSGMKVNLKVRQGSSTSSWDVGNPPTEESHPSNVKTEHNEKDPPRNRPEKVQDTSLKKEYSVRDLFHDKARETEERLVQEGKVPEAQDTKK